MLKCVVHLGRSWPIGKMYEIGNVAKTAVSLARAFVIEYLYIDIEKETKVNELFKVGGMRRDKVDLASIRWKFFDCLCVTQWRAFGRAWHVFCLSGHM